uniref:Uncharacterized protein n=1 Tax=Rhizophora mucronata TaxID=61149 RepID=A0A2P2P2K9_RHIMU
MFFIAYLLLKLWRKNCNYKMCKLGKCLCILCLSVINSNFLKDQEYH